MILDVHLVAGLGVRRVPPPHSARLVLLLPPVHHVARAHREEGHNDKGASSEANYERHIEIRRRVGRDRFDGDGGFRLHSDAEGGRGGVGGAEARGERGPDRRSCGGGGHGDGGGDEHAGGGDADRDERLVDARGGGNLLLQARLVVVRVVADAAAGRQREHDRSRR
eukprot:scaffold5509_cov45-Phaeocystis_antarctica.AAC.1